MSLSKKFNTLKKIASRPFLPSVRARVDDVPRNVTPPTADLSSSDAFTTPPTLVQAQEGPSPEDLILATPRLIDQEVGTSTVTVQSKPQNGITGMDLSADLYDGTSSNEAHHLIELDDDSMEREPDVRAYFWRVGRSQRGGQALERPKKGLERERYDDELVREGRTFLKSARQRGHGYYFNKHRILLDHNKPGDPWYCMPAAGVVKTLYHKDTTLPVQEDEGAFFNGEDDISVVYTKDKILLTNLRAPHLWAKYIKDRYKPGSAYWDAYMFCLYSFDHPVQQARSGREPYEIVNELLLDSDRFTDEAAVDAMIDAYWPRSPPSPDLPPVNLMKLTGSGKPKNFLKLEHKAWNAGKKAKGKK